MVAAGPLRIVLLPGMDGTGDLFSPFVDALSPSLSADIVSYPANRALNYRELESLIRSHLPAAPYILLGESFSGPLAIAIAATQPPHLRGVVLCCTFAQDPRPALSAIGGTLPTRWAMRWIPPHWLARLAQPFLLGRFSTRVLLDLLKSALRKVSPEVMAARTREIRQVNVVGKLSSLNMPVLYLGAEQDRIVRPTASRLLTKHLPNMKLVTIEGPHCLLQASPRATAEVIEDFAASLARKTP